MLISSIIKSFRCCDKYHLALLSIILIQAFFLEGHYIRRFKQWESPESPQRAVGTSVESHTPLPCVVETEEHVDDGGLAAAGAAYQGDGISGGNVEVEPVEDTQEERIQLWAPPPTRRNHMYGHIHIAKTGGTSLNGMLANKFERICGNKGNSFDAYAANELAKKNLVKDKVVSYYQSTTYKRLDMGFEDCDYVSMETDVGAVRFWDGTFGKGRLHNMTMELHMPCREPIDHLMSQCNHRKRKLRCDAKTDEEFYTDIMGCLIFLKQSDRRNRYDHRLKGLFDIKCYDFKKQFTNYWDKMTQLLQPRRVESSPFVKRETNTPRDKATECIWQHPDLMEKANSYLLEKVPYYQFCDTCMGSENEITVTEGTAST